MTDAELLAEIRDDRSLSAAVSTGRSESERSELPVAVRPDAALEELLNRHYSWLSRVCFVELYDTSVALDCLQETMLQIARSIKSFDGRSSLRTWMFIIARRTVARYRKRDITHRQRFPLGKEEDVSKFESIGECEQKGSDELLVQSEQQRKLLGLIRVLPEKQRHAVMFHYFEDLSVEQTAERLGCSVGTVKTHLFRGRERLRVLLEQED